MRANERRVVERMRTLQHAVSSLGAVRINPEESETLLSCGQLGSCQHVRASVRCMRASERRVVERMRTPFGHAQLFTRRSVLRDTGHSPLP